MSVINTNVSALVAQSALTSNSRAQSTAMQQLSTGLRINGAKDDAAGLAIASKMTSQIRGLDQAVRNANDGVSLLQTADGAMTAVSDMLQRMREISVQSASDSNVTSDRAALNTEFSALKTEIGRVASTTQWNGMNILDGSKAGGFTFQVGANNTSAQQINQTIAAVDVSAPPITTVAVAAIGTAGVATTTAQVNTLTLSGTMAVGDTISMSLGANKFAYTIKASDLNAAASEATNETSVLTSMKTAFDANTTLKGLYPTTVVSGSVLTLTGDIASGNPTFTRSVTSGVSSATDISTQSGAQDAIDRVDKTMATVNSTRAGIGATINRLTYAADNLTNVSQNTSASRSRIQDTDYAKASTELARTQIISQAATAMLAQANQSQQSVLALLK
jgi:flagellin